MSRKSTFLLLVCALIALYIAANRNAAPVQAQQSAQAESKLSPAEGYNVHVLAPHLVDGHQMGPYHHYCKVMAPDPQIVCLIYETTVDLRAQANSEPSLAFKLEQELA
jgi:hypothetical protein